MPTAQIWLRDIARDLAAMNAVWEAWLPAGAAPARATCQAQMADPQILIEVIVTAMTRNPIAAFDHRLGFRLGAPIGFKDYVGSP